MSAVFPNIAIGAMLPPAYAGPIAMQEKDAPDSEVAEAVNSDHDEIKSVEEGLVADVKNAFESQSFSDAKVLIGELKKQHPGSTYLVEIDALLIEIDKKESAPLDPESVTKTGSLGLETAHSAGVLDQTNPNGETIEGSDGAVNTNPDNNKSGFSNIATQEFLVNEGRNFGVENKVDIKV